MSTRPCECVTCHVCNGSGRIMVPMNGYPEDDLESCDHCRGYGVEEMCQYCTDSDEDDYYRR